MNDTSNLYSREPQELPRTEEHSGDDLLESSMEQGTVPSVSAVRLDACVPFDTFVVNTLWSVYDVVVLSGDSGEVLVRGGRFFPEFRHAILAGSTAGGSALKMKRIEVGLRMELRFDDRTVTTSHVQSLSEVR